MFFKVTKKCRYLSASAGDLLIISKASADEAKVKKLIKEGVLVFKEDNDPSLPHMKGFM